MNETRNSDVPKRDEENASRHAERLQNETPQSIVQWGVERYHPKLAVVSNFGPSTNVVIHHLAEIGRSDVPIVHINTGFEFEETGEIAQKLERRYGVQIQHVRPELTVEQQAEKYGPKLYSADPDYCCYMRKVAPLERALKGMDAWVTGIRKSQAATRRGAKVVEWDARHDMIKINPMAEWTSERVWEFIRKHNIPYNALHDQGYASVGCWPCTLPVVNGEDERAGRWKGRGKTECGIHLTQPLPPT